MVPVQQELNGFLTAAYNYGDMVIVVVGKFDLGSDLQSWKRLEAFSPLAAQHRTRTGSNPFK